MGKSKVQAFITFILSSGAVIDLFFMSHGVPNLVAGVVAPNVVELGENEKGNGDPEEGKQHGVALVVMGRVAGPVYI